jgi:diguanylate cyclase (GGDEF)-like protein
VTESTSHLGLAIQAVGITLIAILCAFLARSVDRRYLRSWAVGWMCLATALFALFTSFRVPALAPVLEPVYFFGEYAFAFLLVAGCREYASGARLAASDAGWAAPALLLAMALPHVGTTFSTRFIVQAAIMACLFAAAFWQLERRRRLAGPGYPGLQIMSVALMALTLDFMQYVPVLSYAVRRNVALRAAYAGYTSLYDLIFEVTLAFGMVILVLKEVNRELLAANEELRKAHDRLQGQARVDPLTETLNRHAFYSLVEEARRGGHAAGGTVALVDIDGLKPINDAWGHAAGDASIRAVAKAIRSLVRPDDLVIRWGGDEFLVILISVPEEEAALRLDRLGDALRETTLPGAATPVALTVSFGVAAFGPARPLERAIETADRAMYARKQRTKSRRDLTA